MVKTIKKQVFTPVAVFMCFASAVFADPRLLKDINPGTTGSYPEQFTRCGELMYFKAEDKGVPPPTTDITLWRSDGTEAGTMRVKDIVPGGFDMINDLTAVGDILYFTAYDGVDSYVLYKTDGTEEGTLMVVDFDTIGENPRYFTAVDDLLFFSLRDPNGQELWKSDGTAEGTVMVKDIFIQTVGTSGSNPEDLVAVNGTLFFTALHDGNTQWRSLFKSDGTEEGTVIVKDFGTGGTNPDFSYLTNVNGTLFFHARDSIYGAELWKSDGTEEGTVMVKDIRPGSSSVPGYLTGVNDTLFFTAYTDPNGQELWKSDGTEEGTVLVKDIRPGSSSSYLKELTNVNGTLFFNADDGTHSEEPWTSDGTEEGTVMVKDIVPGSGGSYPDGFVESNGRTFFWIYLATQEFWTSDGTEAGTFKLSDMYPEFSNYGSQYTNLNGRLFFSMYVSGSGAEPWIFETFGPEDCDNAVEVGIGQTYFGNTDIAAGTDISSCALDDPNDVWYTFTPPHDGQYTFTLEGSNFDTSLAVYSDCPASAPTQIGCNDNYDPNTYSRVAVSLIEDEDAFIRIAGANRAVGEYELTVVGCEETIRTDLNGDCQVNLADVALFITDWLYCYLEPQELCNP